MGTAAEALALATILFWMAIPLFWIPVHIAPSVFRRLKLHTYWMPLLTWLPLALLVYRHRAAILDPCLQMPMVIKACGILLLALGTALHVWTARLLTLPVIIGVPEVSSNSKSKLTTGGAFSYVRHPTYLAHTLMFAGSFLFTGIVAVGAVTLVDFLVVTLAIIPLEERELVKRFGDAYRSYRERVPRFFPAFRRPDIRGGRHST